MSQFPSFYDPKKVGTLFLTRNTEVAAAGVQFARDNDIAPACDDVAGERVVLTIVDGQVDFIHTNGALSVPGAIEDTRRTIEWIFENVDKITAIVLSLDTHVPFQIFSPLYWVDRLQKLMPNPFTVVSEKDYGRRYMPKFEHPDIQGWNKSYIQKLKADGSKDLMLWPIHCLLGTAGYSIEPSLMEAVLFWSAVREANPVWLTKGDDHFTEMYAIEVAEVPNPYNTNTQLNTQFLNMLTEYDRIYFVGQAKSHCVFETIAKAIGVFQSGASYVLPRMRPMMDAMSSVGTIYDTQGNVVVDFDALVTPVYNDWQRLGLVLDRTTDANGNPIRIQF